MKITFNTADAAPVLAACSRIANPNATLPILSNILVSATDEGVELRATNYETEIRMQLVADVENPGELTVPARLFSDIIGSLEKSKATATLETFGKGARLRCADTTAELQIMPARDFPKRQDFTIAATYEVSQPELAVLLEKITPAIPAKDPRKALLGALATFDGGKLSMVATDGKVLAYSDIAVETGERSSSLILPAKTLEEVARHLGQSGTVSVAHDDLLRQVVVTGPGWQVVTNTIEGNYPNWRRVIPSEFDRRLVLPREAVRRVLRRVSILADRQSNAVRFEFDGVGLTISAESAESGGRMSERVSVPDSGQFQFHVNYRFMEFIMDAIGTANVVMSANQPVTPIVFRPDAETTDLYLVMPIKVVNREQDYEEDGDGDE